jgi:excisionase family DNA binding protein
VSQHLFTARELGAYLGVSPGTILDWWEAGKIPGFKFGRAVRFDLDEVLATGRTQKESVSPFPLRAPTPRASLGKSPFPYEGES